MVDGRLVPIRCARLRHFSLGSRMAHLQYRRMREIVPRYASEGKQENLREMLTGHIAGQWAMNCG